MADKLGRQAVRCTAGLLLVFVCLLGAVAQAGAQGIQHTRATARFSGVKYVVQAGDVLRVRIWGWPEPSSNVEGSFPVEASGAAYLPVIGRHEVAGKTVEDVQEEFRRRFEQEQRNPVVTVTALFAVGVMGEVQVPGVLDAEPGYTVFDAISLAGGFTQNANRTHVLVVRKGQRLEVTGSSAAEAASAYAAMPLESGDRVVVQRSRTSGVPMLNTAFQALLSAATLIVLLTR